MTSYVQYEQDTKVAMAGNTITFYRTTIHLDDKGKMALKMLRQDGEQLKIPLQRLLDIGVKEVLRDGNVQGLVKKG